MSGAAPTAAPDIGATTTPAAGPAAADSPDLVAK